MYDVTPGGVAVSKGAQTIVQTVRMTQGGQQCDWDMSSSAPWVTFDGSSPVPHAGDGSVTISVAENTTGATLSAAINIVGLKTVTQLATP